MCYHYKNIQEKKKDLRHLIDFLKDFFYADHFLKYWIYYNITYVSCIGFLASRPSSLTRNRTNTPCIERQSVKHWTTREVPH